MNLTGVAGRELLVEAQDDCKALPLGKLLQRREQLVAVCNVLIHGTHAPQVASSASPGPVGRSTPACCLAHLVDHGLTQVRADAADLAGPPLDIDLGHRLGHGVLGSMTITAVQVRQPYNSWIVLTEHVGERHLGGHPAHR